MIQALCNYGGLLLAVLSIIATAYFAKRYSEKKLPRFFSLTLRRIALSRSAEEGIAVHYKGSPVRRISSTLIWFWNGGSRPIRSDDLPESQPLAMDMRDEDGEFEILDVVVRKTTREAIGFRAAKKSKTAISIAFLFLDRNDGALIEVLHTGSAEADVAASGIILGAPDGVQRVRRWDKLWKRLSPLYMGFRLPRRRLSLFARIIASAIYLAMATTIIAMAVTATREITTTETRLASQLADFVAPSELKQAVTSVVSNSKYRLLQSAFIPAMAALFVAAALLATVMVWRFSFPFPRTLASGEENPGERKLGDQKIPS